MHLYDAPIIDNRLCMQAVNILVEDSCDSNKPNIESFESSLIPPMAIQSKFHPTFWRGNLALAQNQKMIGVSKYMFFR